MLYPELASDRSLLWCQAIVGNSAAGVLLHNARRYLWL